MGRNFNRFRAGDAEAAQRIRDEREWEINAPVRAARVAAEAERNLAKEKLLGEAALEYLKSTPEGMLPEDARKRAWAMARAFVAEGE